MNDEELNRLNELNQLHREGGVQGREQAEQALGAPIRQIRPNPSKSEFFRPEAMSFLFFVERMGDFRALPTASRRYSPAMAGPACATVRAGSNRVRPSPTRSKQVQVKIQADQTKSKWITPLACVGHLGGLCGNWSLRVMEF